MRLTQLVQMNEIVKEGEFRRSRERNGKNAVKEAEARRKRMSMLTRRDVRENNQEGEMKLKQMQKVEKQRLHDEAAAASSATRDYKKKEAEKKRLSMAGRVAAWSEVKQVEEEINNKEKALEHESFELKAAGMRDADKYKKQCAEDRRKSMAGRGEQGRYEQMVKENLRAEELRRQYMDGDMDQGANLDVIQHKRDLAAEERADYEQRNADGFNAKQASEEIRNQQLQQQFASGELSRGAHQDVIQHKRNLLAEERADYEQRNADGFNAKQASEEIRNQQLQQQFASGELSRGAHQDVIQHKRNLLAEERADYEQRNADSSNSAHAAEEIRNQQLLQQYEDGDLSRAAASDVANYKKQCAVARRQSFESRNANHSQQRRIMAEIISLQSEKEHESMILKWAGQKDADTYLKEEKEKERQDFEQRNAHNLHGRNVEEELRQQDLTARRQSSDFKRGAQADVNDYKQQCAAEESADYAARVAHGRHEREVEEDSRKHMLEAQRMDEELASGNATDVNTYKQKLADRDRNSFCFRNTEARIQRLKEETEDVLKKEREQVSDERVVGSALLRSSINGARHSNFPLFSPPPPLFTNSPPFSHTCVWAHKRCRPLFTHVCGAPLTQPPSQETRELEDQARDDVRKYVASCKRRNRLSLVGRAREKRHAAEVTEGMRQEQIQNFSNEARNRAMDARWAGLAREREAAERTIMALRHKGCTFAAVNPFANLLE